MDSMAVTSGASSAAVISLMKLRSILTMQNGSDRSRPSME